MTKFILTLTGIFLAFTLVASVQNIGSIEGQQIGIDKKESVVQQGKNVKLDEVEVQEDLPPTPADKGQGQGQGQTNELKIQIQNKGEDNQIQTQTEEQEQVNQSEDKGIGKQVREMAIEQAGQAAQNAFQQMSQNMGEEMGLGEQVSELAKEQNQVQEKINQGVEKVKNRNRFMKFLSARIKLP